MINSNTTFWGYRRENGRVGVRNHVIILPVDDLSNAACDAVANNIKGTLAISHPYGRLQFGADLELHFRTLIGATNPAQAAEGTIRKLDAASVGENAVQGSDSDENAPTGPEPLTRLSSLRESSRGDMSCRAKWTASR